MIHRGPGVYVGDNVQLEPQVDALRQLIRSHWERGQSLGTIPVEAMGRIGLRLWPVEPSEQIKQALLEVDTWS
jgi:hypothetical protein